MKTFPRILQTLFNSRSTAGSINFWDLKAAQGQQETDYWGLSLKEGMEWLIQNAAANSTIVVAGPMFAAQMVQDYQKNLTMIYRDDFAWGKAADPDYYAFPYCPIVHAVQRQDTPLTIIKHCRQP